MKRNLIVVLVLLATLSIVNAIPLHKRVTTFGPCGGADAPNLLTVTVSPDPIVPGQTNTFTVTGELSEPATKGSALLIGFFDPKTNDLVGDATIVDICSGINNVECPIKNFGASGPVPVPPTLPSYDIVVLIVDSTSKVDLGCAATHTGSGPSGGTSNLSLQRNNFIVAPGTTPSTTLWKK